MRKRTAETALFSYYHLSIHFIPFYSYANTENLILSRKLPFCFRVRIWVLPASIRVSVIISDFCLRVYTIRQKNPRTKVRTLANVKMPLKAHGTQPLPAKAGRFGLLLKQPKVCTLYVFLLSFTFILSRSYRNYSSPVNPDSECTL